MPPAAVAGLRDLLRGARLMVEYGAGGSTIMAARMGVQVVSVEADHHFADAVVKAAADRRLGGVRMLKANVGWTVDWSYPFDRYPTPANIARWRGYAEMPWRAVGERCPDLILVDGRFRKACVAQSVLECLRRGAAPPIVLDDYIGREKYAEVQELVEVAELWDRTALLRIRPDVREQDAEAAVSRWITSQD